MAATNRKLIIKQWRPPTENVIERPTAATNREGNEITLRMVAAIGGGHCKTDETYSPNFLHTSKKAGCSSFLSKLTLMPASVSLS